MYLDSSQNNVHNLVSDMQRGVDMNNSLDLVTKLGAKLNFFDGVYSWYWEANPELTISGTGKSPMQAMHDFYNNFQKQSK